MTRARLGALAAATVVATSVGSSLAANYTWQTTGTTNNWSTAAGDTNWFVDAGTTLSPWADANAAILDAATGETITLAGTVAPASTAVNNNGSWVLDGTGVLGGTGTLTKNGTGTLTLSNTVANTFSGGTTINGGILAIGTGGTGANTSTVSALGTGQATINSGGTLKLWIQNSTAFTIANNLSIDGGNILNEDGNHTLSGTVAVGAGGATLRSKWNGKNLTLTGVISGDGGVTIARPAEGGGAVDSNVILTNSNTYTGNTTVTAARLQLGNNVATDKGGTGVIRGDLTVNSPGLLTLGFTNALGYNAGAKVNNLNINGATVDHTANGDNGWGLAYNFSNGGTLQTTGTGRFSLGGGSAINTLASPTSSTINGSLWMRDSNPDNLVPFTTADGAAVYDLVVNANIGMGSGGEGVGINKLGAGTMLMNGPASTFTGPTNVNEGTLALGLTGTLATSPVSVASGATFRTDAGGRTLASLSAAGGSTLGLIAAPGVTTTVTGALDLTSGTINIAPTLGAGVVNGVYDLVTAGSITGSGTPVVSFNGPYGSSRATGTVAVNGNKLQLTLTGTGAGLVWNNASGAGAATGTWDLNATANFDNGGSNDVFKAFDSVIFNDSVAAGSAKTINLAGGLAPSSLTAANSNGDYTLTAATAGGGQLLGVGSLVKTGSSSLILGGNLTYGMVGEISVSGGTFDLGGKTLPAQPKFTLSGGATLANGTLPVSGTSDLQQGTISGVLSGAGAVTKSTANTVTLTGNSTVTGTTTIAEGTLQIGSGSNTGNLGSGPVVIQTGGTLNYLRSDNPMPAIANPISGTGTLSFSGTGTLLQSSYTLTGNNSGFSGAIQASNTRVGIDNVNDIGTAALSTGTNGQFWVTAGTHANAFTLSGNGWLEGTVDVPVQYGAIRFGGGTVSGPVTLAGDTRLTTQGSTGTISGNIGESGGARNLEIGVTGGSSNLTLSGTNTYTGTTTLTAATLNLRGSLASSAVNVGAGSTLSGNGSITGPVTFAAGATNLGVNLGLPGTLTTAGAATFNGTTTVTVTPAPGLTPGGSIPLMNYASTTATPANFVLANSANFRQAVFNVGATGLTLNLGSKAVTWSGTGGLTWDVATTSNWLDGASPSPYYQGDAVNFTDAAGTANGTVTITAALTPASVTVNNSTTVPYTFTGAGSIGGGASLTKTGTGDLNLNAAMTYSGGTVVNGGRVIVDGNGPGNRQVAGGLITVNNTGTFEVRGVNAMPNAANSPNVTVNAGGTLRLVTGFSPVATAANSHAHLGNLTLNGGTVDMTYSGTGAAYNNESMQLNGTLTVGGSAPSIIQSSETTANQGIALPGNRTFAIANVTGNANPDLVITAEVENSDSDNGLLTKTGAGTLELVAPNSYSGGTNVTEGTLTISNALNGSATGTGAVTIAAGATLNGNGTATGATTIAGTVAPGPGIGQIRTGALTLTGTYACEIDGIASDLLEVNGNINLSGATLNLSQVTPATETSYVIGSWTGTRTGSFATVTGLPTGLSVIYDENAKLILIGVATGFTEWIGGFPGLSDTTAGGDPDNDGFVNLLEYILGGNPGESSTAIAPTQLVTGSNVEFSFKRSDDSEGDTTQIVQWSTDLESWTDIPIPGSSAGNVAIIENGANSDDVKVTIPRAANTKIFVRFTAAN
ncbi:beta strand repeat-containing protein [Luteolibacter luteus]|uniref:Autotransporter domain-containing protein n=1 Tax=Luteolibacter luteus TaxID=2728835 RepID=A0A858RGC2_9BACT|nr:autotransporter-associated beta strand repeat-containing protein [Luteolibacter luteus]QJE96186.1 hypothetical protein HHL09_10445 [Luteolibacter luteus]